MTSNLLNTFKRCFTFLALVSMALIVVNCKSEVSSKQQQKAFHVDAAGNLLNKKNEIVKKAGDFKLEGGFFVDSSGEPIKRGIDKAKEKLNAKMGDAKDKLSNAADNTKDKLSAAADKTKDKLSAAAAGLSAVNVKSKFNKMFNTKAVGTAYALTDIAFDKESHRITAMSKEEVEGMAAALKEHPESRIQVQVHTADGKNKTECKKISSLRADVVKNMLVTLGVNANQISAKGLGLTTSDAAKAVANVVEVVVEK